MMRRLIVALAIFAATTGSAGAQSGYEQAIHEACARHGCNGDYLVAVMLCESGGDPNAWHPNPYGGSDVGLFQIHDLTWGSIAYADPYSQIEWAAAMFAAGQSHHWVCAR